MVRNDISCRDLGFSELIPLREYMVHQEQCRIHSKAEEPLPGFFQARGEGWGGIGGDRCQRCSPYQMWGIRLVLSAVSDPGITVGWHLMQTLVDLLWWTNTEKRLMSCLVPLNTCFVKYQLYCTCLM